MKKIEFSSKKSGGILEPYFAGKARNLNEIRNKLIREYNKTLEKPISSKNPIASKVAKHVKCKLLKGYICRIERKLEIIYKHKLPDNYNSWTESYYEFSKYSDINFYPLTDLAIKELYLIFLQENYDCVKKHKDGKDNI